MTTPNPSEAVHTTATAAHGAVGKGVSALAKRKPLVLGGLVLGILIITYVIHKRNAAASSDVMANADQASAAASDGTNPGYADSTYYPGSTQGAYMGGGDPSQIDTSTSQDAHSPSMTLDDWLNLMTTLYPNGFPGTGGGPPANPGVGAHTVSGSDPTPTYTPPQTQPAPAPAPAPPPPPPPTTPTAPAGIQVGDRFFPGATSSHMDGGGRNQYGTYVVHVIVYPGRTERWWHYTQGSARGKWTGPH